MKKHLIRILAIIILVVLSSFLIIYNLNNKDTNSKDSNTKSDSVNQSNSNQTDNIDVSELLFSVDTTDNRGTYIITNSEIKQNILEEMQNITINNLNINEQDFEIAKGGEQYYLNITDSNGEIVQYLGLILSSKANVQIDDNYYNVSHDIRNKLVELLKNN